MVEGVYECGLQRLGLNPAKMKSPFNVSLVHIGFRLKNGGWGLGLGVGFGDGAGWGCE